MSYKIQAESSFTVVGIATRTSNQRVDEIGQLWQRFYASNVAAQVVSRLDTRVYSVYSDYDSDASGEYNLLIGCAVPADLLVVQVPEGMTQKTVSASKYALFEASGELPAGIVAAWREVWSSDLNRSYDTDFERYEEDGTATVHVGIR